MRHDHARACEEKSREWIKKEWGKFGHYPSTSFKGFAVRAYEAGWGAGCEFLIADMGFSGKIRTGELIARLDDAERLMRAADHNFRVHEAIAQNVVDGKNIPPADPHVRAAQFRTHAIPLELFLYGKIMDEPVGGRPAIDLEAERFEISENRERKSGQIVDLVQDIFCPDFDPSTPLRVNGDRYVREGVVQEDWDGMIKDVTSQIDGAYQSVAAGADKVARLLEELSLGPARSVDSVADITDSLPKRKAPPSLKPITGGPLGDPNVVSSLLTAAKGEPDAPTEAVQHRVDGVADLLACRLQTGEPKFHPERPVTINGFLYKPVDVPTEGKE